MEIRHTTTKDLPEVMEVYAFARKYMKESGNPNQWGDTKPTLQMIEEDIANQTSYVVVENDRICGVFAFIIGADPTYAVIEDGEWLNDEPYGVIHRIAGNGTCKGILAAAVAYGKNYVTNIRIDTHHDNKTMQHLLDKHGFTRCGIIYLEDGNPRIAYHKELMRS